MNIFTQRSIELAAQGNYLDKLFKVYPLMPGLPRQLDKELWNDIVAAFNSGNDEQLISALLKLDLFPVKDGYLPFLRRSPEAIARNPQTVSRIAKRVRQLGLTELQKRCIEPKETNRQMGQLFRKWLGSGALQLPMIDEQQFLASPGVDAVLQGSDESLMSFAKKHLGYNRDKGLDLIVRVNGKYVIGEAKFISDEGGHQNDQFLDAMSTLATPVNDGVTTVAVLDGVLYLQSGKKMYTEITGADLSVMSALVLRDFLNTLLQSLNSWKPICS